ncbi:hypothetical protein MPTK1_7g17920 [Marchantia polymorpha subsp. ruderalis]|uniref:Uncharacterized protein n=2 Tax=Marchantia polymorpha TaxID=3197 RepID=A0AAF6C0X2_MARPO|nr:hypothetical protein MARPO_0102s0048 [Marchantia polymorpha]BBN17906.1 hypothetical protein Mp_7g17920 [Marchantia polymorpha subsp. ruderalis]|eukprot:PTQ32184.1 hypothetical protein MARPO_0102s0048 [Marchantia polymorpha]
MCDCCSCNYDDYCKNCSPTTCPLSDGHDLAHSAALAAKVFQRFFQLIRVAVVVALWMVEFKLLPTSKISRERVKIPAMHCHLNQHRAHDTPLN